MSGYAAEDFEIRLQQKLRVPHLDRVQDLYFSNTMRWNGREAEN
jgi:hypothetical protein